MRALLQREDLEVFATDSREQALARLPFEVSKVKLPPANDPSFKEAVKQFCVDNDIKMILPCLDDVAIVLSREKDFFARYGISIPLPEYEVLLRAVDKWRLTETAEEAGVPYPKTICLRSEEDLEKIAKLAYPIIAKPRFGYGARGVLIYERPPSDWSKLRRLLRRGEAVVQEYIPGGTGSIHLCAFLVDQKHEIKFTFQSKSTKTEFDFGGPALAGISLRDPVLESYGRRLLDALRSWVGIAQMEFKRHEVTGDFYIMDLNPRIWGYSSLAEDSGISFPLGAVLVAENKTFRTHDDYLTDMYVERRELVDESTYTFSCGKTIVVSRPPQYLAGCPRTIAVITNERNKEAISSALRDPEIHAVLVVMDSERNDPIPPHANEKLYLWSPPPALFQQEDLAFWAGHLLQATDVRVVDGETAKTYRWNQLRKRWWFDS